MAYMQKKLIVCYNLMYIVSAQCLNTFRVLVQTLTECSYIPLSLYRYFNYR